MVRSCGGVTSPQVRKASSLKIELLNVSWQLIISPGNERRQQPLGSGYLGIRLCRKLLLLLMFQVYHRDTKATSLITNDWGNFAKLWIFGAFSLVFAVVFHQLSYFCDFFRFLPSFPANNSAWWTPASSIFLVIGQQHKILQSNPNLWQEDANPPS